MSMESQEPQPSGGIDWGTPQGPRNVWEAEAEPPRRRWMIPLLLAFVLLAGSGVAVVAVLRGSGRPARATSPEALALGVQSFTARVIGPVEVELRWAASSPAEEFVLIRDGTVLTTILAPNTVYRDISVAPESTYQYAIEAVDASGSHSDRVVATATTPPAPPISEARVEGTWDVTMTYVEENYTNRRTGSKERQTWVLTPECESGACDVSIDLGLEEQERIVLGRAGRDYGGKGKGKLDRCGRTLLDTTITIELTVAEAEFVAGVWQATRLTGSHETRSAAALSCGAGHAERTVEAVTQA